MSLIELPNERHRVIARQVAEGRASNPAEFLEEAVRRLVEEAGVEEDELRQVIESGLADIEAGLHVTVATKEDERRVLDGMMARLRTRVSTDD